jgi:hypothetical protein
MIGAQMPPGYRFVPQPNDVAAFVLGKCTWAVLALTCHIELFTQAHYRQSIEPDRTSRRCSRTSCSHWKEESQHAIVDELEWRREHDKLDAAARDHAVDDLIALVAGVDGLLQLQAPADVGVLRRLRGTASAGVGNEAPARLHAGGVSLAVHRVGRPGAALRGAARVHGDARADVAHRRGARADHAMTPHTDPE